MVVVIAVLYLARDVLIPLALAVVFSFLLTPVVTGLERFRLGRVPAVLVVLALSFVLLVSVGWGVTGQLIEITGQLPNYRVNIHNKVQALRKRKTHDLGKATAGVKGLGKELAASSESTTSLATNNQGVNDSGKPVRPVPVRVAEPPGNALENPRTLLGTL
jgi:predicted PurR-regulated permease PerM